MSHTEHLSCAFLDAVHGGESKQLVVSLQPFLQPNTFISSDVLGQLKRGLGSYLSK